MIDDLRAEEDDDRFLGVNSLDERGPVSREAFRTLPSAGRPSIAHPSPN